MNKSTGLDYKYEATSIELFLDLIYSFALSQITEFIMKDLIWLTLVKAFILLGAIYMVWAYTSWAATMIPTGHAQSRRMILVVLLLGFFMNLSAESAFQSQGYVFAGLYLGIQFGRTAWTLVFAPNAEFKEHFHRVLIWQVSSSPLWILGMLCTEKMKIAVWGAAILVDLFGTWTAHPLLRRKLVSEDLSFDDGHLLERCRLFRIIALGEMVYSAGDALKGIHLDFTAVVLAVVSMAEIASLWMLSFGRFVKIVAGHRKSNSNPVMVSRYAVNVLFFILVGIVCITVGNNYILEHPYSKVPGLIACLFGSGPVIFLLAQGWYQHRITKIKPLLYGISGIVLIMTNSFALNQEAWVYQIIQGGILFLVSFIDHRIEA